ncbi:MAG TPA: hypothetical protein VFO38_05710 [Candidatus Saccharimonadales bacterium]|nr:hypothetical protein [Candidatus Saccharimonadales bacterium]
MAEFNEDDHIKTVADAIEVALIDAEDLAEAGNYNEAITLADRAAQIAYSKGNVVLAVKAASDAHRYNARSLTLAEFWKSFHEFYSIVRNEWLQGRSDAEAKQAYVLLQELETFGDDLAKQRALEAPED